MKNSKIKRKVLTIFILTFLVSNLFVIKGSSYEQLDYWYSDSSQIGEWFSTPSISDNKLNSNYSFYFNIGYDHARSQWNSAGISTSDTSNFSSADIQVYGGTYDELKQTGEFDDLSSSSTGICYYDIRYFYQYYEYNSSIKTGYEHVYCHIGIKDRGATSSEYKKTCTHELAHSLGWNGHASGSSNIMYAYSTSVTSLTSIDKNQLLQVY